ncbi:MAG TPA: hypothetical protein VGQ06_08200 [Gemmatimonadales bacterium]|jgi:hypothetical protein|nr:hypothetical protein [Gemmatimonadales bacterium]
MDGISKRLAQLRREVEREWKQRTKRDERAKRGAASPQRPIEWRQLPHILLQGAARLLVIVALPFFVLVRGSVFFYEHGRVPAWIAVPTAAVLTMAVVTIYASWLVRTLTGRKSKALMLARWVAVPLVVFYCGYSLLYLSRVNAKPDVRAYYTSVHPLLRLALSTWILVDPNMVVTDMRRAREDYPRMRLPVNESSLHYRQADGWVHAVDLRTARRGWLRSRVLQVYFWAMGFDTRRHVGTADHLHVELR